MPAFSINSAPAPASDVIKVSGVLYFPLVPCLNFLAFVNNEIIDANCAIVPNIKGMLNGNGAAAADFAWPSAAFALITPRLIQEEISLH